MPLGKLVRYLTVSALLFAITGCKSLPSHPPAITPQQSHASAASPLDEFLNEAPANSQQVVATTPWGSNIELMAQAPYFAASGRTCRPLTLHRNGQEVEAALACQNKAGQWQAYPLYH